MWIGNFSPVKCCMSIPDASLPWKRVFGLKFSRQEISRRRCSVAKGSFLQRSMGPEKYGFNLYRFHVSQAGCFRLLLKGAAEREKAPSWDLSAIYLGISPDCYIPTTRASPFVVKRRSRYLVESACPACRNVVEIPIYRGPMECF